MNYFSFYNKAKELLIDSLASLWFKGQAQEQEYIKRILTKDEPLFAEPVFQSIFPWEESADSFEEHSSKLRLLTPSFVNALSSEEIDKDLRFPLDRHPYKHQTESWRTMLSSRPQTIVVTTGTGSGKTECFMIPVLQDLAKTNEKNCVQAIFLYPLNALMKSQQKRIHAWCKALPEKVTYAPGLWFRLQWAFLLGTKILTFLNRKATDVINSFESAYYFSRKTELEQELESIASALQSIDIQKSMKELRSSSLQLLKDKIAKRYNTGQRKKFTIKDIKRRTEEFLKEYPIVLSTTYSAKSCISKDMVFDYVIMDEASQVDIKTGALALSCAMNAVIVGDDKQLPNVVSREEELALRAIQTTYQVDDRYNAVTHSFLQSCVEIFRDAPVTLLREHYRCHPKIIEFCNQRFYNGELIAMTTDEGEKDVLQVIRTVPGNHARGHFNQREIDVITQEVLSECTESESIGIITPYRAQAEAINQAIRKDISSTVHKYQGRECDTIIMSMVDNSPTEFSDDANLLNVAISRAKSKLCLVTNGNEMPEDSNLSQLISYIQYNNFEVKSSKLHSVFDLLYQQYTAERLAYEAAHPAVSEHLSENLIYDILLKAIAELGLPHTGVLCHYPLSRLITDWNQLEDKEKTFAESPFSHIDFLLYNSLTKQPISAIEVDGWHFHKENDAQLSRDKLKNQIFTKLGLPLIRISTTDTVNQETIKKSLLAIL